MLTGRQTLIPAVLLCTLVDSSQAAAPGDPSSASRPSPNALDERPVSASVERTTSESLRELRASDSVAGRRVGYEGLPSEFYVVSEKLLSAHDVDFAALAEDASPVVRAMGLVGLIQGNSPRALPALKAALGDMAVVHYFPDGCVGSDAPLGAIARDLLANPSKLGHRGVSRPLLSPAELTGVDIETLALDDRTPMHPFAAANLGPALDGHGVVLRYPDIGTSLPEIPLWQILKALGRYQVEDGSRGPAIRDLLIAAARDQHLDARARLAAASALTRFPDPAVLSELTALHEQLDAISPDRPATELLDTLRQNIAVERLLAPVREASTWMQTEKLADRVRRAWRGSHPVLLASIAQLGFGYYGKETKSVAKARDAALSRIAKESAAHDRPWDTYSNAAYLLASGRERAAKATYVE